MSENYDALFAQAEDNTKTLEEKGKSSYQRDERIIDLSVGLNETKTIYFRMFPDYTNNKKPKLHLPYKVYNFKSPVTGKMAYGGISPSVFDQKDYFKETQDKLWDIDKELAKCLFPTDKRFVNIYVISDSSNDENNGKTMILNYTAKPSDPKRPKAGSPFLKYLEGLALDSENGITLLDTYSLSPNGITFKMEIVGGQTKNDFTEIIISHYEGSKNVKGFKGLSDVDIEEIFKNNTVDLLTLLEEPKTEDEVKSFLDKYLLNNTTSESDGTSSASQYFDDQEEEDEKDEIPSFDDVKTEQVVEEQPKSGNPELDELLNGL